MDLAHPVLGQLGHDRLQGIVISSQVLLAGSSIPDNSLLQGAVCSLPARPAGIFSSCAWRCLGPKGPQDEGQIGSLKLSGGRVLSAKLHTSAAGRFARLLHGAGACSPAWLRCPGTHAQATCTGQARLSLKTSGLHGVQGSFTERVSMDVTSWTLAVIGVWLSSMQGAQT